jgi:hypothetical protein
VAGAQARSLQLLFVGLSDCVFSRGCKGFQKVKNTFRRDRDAGVIHRVQAEFQGGEISLAAVKMQTVWNVYTGRTVIRNRTFFVLLLIS